MTRFHDRHPGTASHLVITAFRVRMTGPARMLPQVASR
jgi:hypothetical protein